MDKTKTILKIIEIAVTAIGTAGSIYATLTTAKIKDDDIKKISSETARQVIEEMKKADAM